MAVYYIKYYFKIYQIGMVVFMCQFVVKFIMYYWQFLKNALKFCGEINTMELTCQIWYNEVSLREVVILCTTDKT